MNVMVAPIRQIVTVGKDGRIEILDSGLPGGTRAEVTVTPVPKETLSQLEALKALQASLKLDRAAAEAWAQQVREERAANRRPL
jgi:hypothetical protein